jgi:hypothetical protein
MRKVPILTVLALLGLFVGQVSAATIDANEPADINLAPGATGDNVFDLNDYFASEGDLTFSAVSGGSVSGSMASVTGGSAGDEVPFAFSASDGTDTMEIGGTVYVSDFMISDIDIDDNNRIVGMAGGNPFVNGLAAGMSASGMLTGLPAPGTGGTPGGATGAGGAALVATLGSVDLAVAPTGLRQRSSMMVDSVPGLAATLNADGSYSIDASAGFAGAWIVTLGADAGAGNKDAVHVLAAEAEEVAIEAANFTVVDPLGAGNNVTFANNAITITVDAGQAALVVSNTPVSVGSMATVSYDYTSTSDAVSLATIGFDGALDGATVQFSNLTGGNVDGSGTMKNSAISFASASGSVLWAAQVFNGGTSTATVVISGCKVIKAGSLSMYALNPNAKVATPSTSATDGWTADILGAGAAAPVASTEDNFAGAAGSLALNGVGGVSNASALGVSVGQGTMEAEAYVKRMGDADAGSTFVVHVTDGANQFQSTVPGATVPTDSWHKVSVSGTVSVANPGLILVVQAAGVNVVVDDVAVRVIDEPAGGFDRNLLP